MLVSQNWLQEYLEETLPSQGEALGEALTMHTAEVDTVTPRGAHLANITVARITQLEPHPNADKLRLATVEVEAGRTEKVVCGAPNLEIGMLVPYAPLGTEFPNGLKLEPKKIRGVVSQGMLCSAAELELGEDHSGILKLDDDAPINQSMSELLGQSADFVIDIDNKAITHRPDLWGHYGLARECAAMFDLRLKDTFGTDWLGAQQGKLGKASDSPVPIDVQPNTCCIGYFGLSVDNVTVAPSPAWMQERLLAVGLRPINNLVDIGNYVMLETGGPLHMFDREKIGGGKIVVRPATSGEKLELLDGQTVQLEESDTVVADAERALVVAGIMGGEDSGIQDSTTSILIEAANWERSAVRKTSTRLGIRTDSSQRFEKGLDPLGMETTILRAMELVLQLCPEATIRGALEYGGDDLSKISSAQITCSAARVNALLGSDHSFERMQQSLEKLGFGVTGSAESFEVSVPSYRATREFEHQADVVEEIGRVLGYEAITPTPPLCPIATNRPTNLRSIEHEIRDFLSVHGRFLEVQTYPLVGEKLLARADWPVDAPLKLQNPISVEQDRMRPSLVPSLIEAAAENAKHFESFRVFELARSYHAGKDSYCDEQRELSLGIYSSSGGDPFRTLVDVIEPLLEHLRVPFQCVETQSKHPHPLIPLEWNGRHPHASRTFSAYGGFIGEIVEIHPLLLRSLKVKGQLVVAAINVSAIAERRSVRKSGYVPLSRFPSSTFDCTVCVDPKSEIQALTGVMQRFKQKEVLSRSVVTEYAPTKEERYVTVRIELGSDKETLSGERISELEKDFIAHLTKHEYPLKPG